jgi:hypothetical protein
MTREELTVYYEELRTQALASTGRGLGLTLFLREGMYSWMRACAGSIALAQRNVTGRVVAVDRGEVVVSAEFTMLLAGLALEVSKEVVIEP